MRRAPDRGEASPRPRQRCFPVARSTCATAISPPCTCGGPAGPCRWPARSFSARFFPTRSREADPALAGIGNAAPFGSRSPMRPLWNPCGNRSCETRAPIGPRRFSTASRAAARSPRGFAPRMRHHRRRHQSGRSSHPEVRARLPALRFKRTVLTAPSLVEEFADWASWVEDASDAGSSRVPFPRPGRHRTAVCFWASTFPAPTLLRRTIAARFVPEAGARATAGPCRLRLQQRPCRAARRHGAPC